MKTSKERAADTFVYVDESGTFPLEDENIFVVAALAFRCSVSDTLDKHSATLDAVLARVRELDGVMALNYVKPFAGFASRFNAKLDKMELMARATKLTTGKHLYLSGNKIESRNMMWGGSIRGAALSALTGALVKGSPGRVDVIVDRKTMADASKRFFDDQAEMMMKYIMSINELPELNGMIIPMPTAIRVRLSDDPTVCNAKGGLRLADVIARGALRELRDTGDVSSFRGRDRRDGIRDMTQHLLEPISRDAIEEFRRNTGLPEPRIDLSF